MTKNVRKKFTDEKKFTYPYPSIKDVQVTKEAFSSQKRTFSPSKHKFSFIFFTFIYISCPPGSGSTDLIKSGSVTLLFCPLWYLSFWRRYVAVYSFRLEREGQSYGINVFFAVVLICSPTPPPISWEASSVRDTEGPKSKRHLRAVLWIRNDFFRIRIVLFSWFRIRILIPVSDPT
jgi:hypothetical protein